jgi:tetratricopeptide (TPR) repeat protein
MRGDLIRGVGSVLLSIALAFDAVSAQSGRSATDQAVIEGSLAALRDAVRRQPSDAAARRRLALALHDTKRYDEAVEQFEQAARLAPGAQSLLDLALGYTSASRLNDATATYGKLLVQVPGHAVALHNLGNLAMKRGAIEDGLANYRRAIQANPRYLLAYFHLGEALHQAGRHAEAYRAYESALAIEPRTPQELEASDNALFKLASLDLANGAHARALAMLDALVEANPRHPRAHHARGQALMQLNRTEEARRAFAVHMQLLAQQEITGPAASGE